MSVMILAESDTPPIVPQDVAAMDLAGVDPATADLADRPPRELGMLYAAGRVVPRDLVAAHMWLNIAALKGDREAARQRQEIAGEMSKDEIARALSGARAWLDRQAQQQSA